jgi:hypothetical protein
LRPLIHAALAATLFGIIVGAKWLTIDRFGSAMPDADQWDAEGLHLLIPWFEGGDIQGALFQPHNEHRVVLTKLQALALVLANGQWDARLEAVCNAVLHAALGVALWWLARGWVASRWHAPLFLLVAALFSLPLGWENTLGGFHSQQYWLLGLSVVALVALPFARPWSASWWMGASAAALALLAMGSGFSAALMVLTLGGFRALRGETSLRESWPTWALASLLAIVGAATRVDVPAHAMFHAHSVSEFLLYCLRSLAWPLRGHDWVGALLWAPWVAIVIQVFRSRNDRSAQTLALLGGWILLQILATAYARGADANYPAPRYTDTVALGAAINAVALAWWLSRVRGWLAPIGGLVWLVTLAIGLGQATDRTLRHEIPEKTRYYRAAETHLRGYLATYDPAQLAFPDAPYPDAAVLIERLGHRSLRTILPMEVSPPPVERKPLSHLAWILARNGQSVATIAGGISVILGILLLVLPRKTAGPGDSLDARRSHGMSRPSDLAAS